jgi:hypothetical protein
MKRKSARRLVLACFLLLGIANAASAGALNVDITVRDKKTGQPVPCRIHLTSSQPVK